MSWLLLSTLITFLAVDEFASIHEQISRKLENTLELTGIFYWTWVIPYSGLVLLVLIVFSRFLYLLPRVTASRMITAGGVYVFGALILEMTVPIMLFLVTVEESLEMVGMMLFLRAVLIHLTEGRTPGVSIELIHNNR